MHRCNLSVGDDAITYYTAFSQLHQRLLVEMFEKRTLLIMIQRNVPKVFSQSWYSQCVNSQQLIDISYGVYCKQIHRLLVYMYKEAIALLQMYVRKTEQFTCH